MRDWLESDGNKDTLIEGVQTVVNKAIDTKRLKQLELDFVRRITEEWPSLNPVTDQEGWKEPAKKKRKKSLKKLAKENSKVSDWLGTKTSAITEVNESSDAIREDVEIMEIEISEECNQPNPMMIERLLKRDRLLEVWNGRRIVKELIVEMVGMVPELAAENMYKMMANKKARAVDRKMIGDLVSEMTMEVPGVSGATNIMREVLEMACWRARVNQVWAIMEGDRRIQRLIEWRMDNQRMDERITLESIRKEERLERVEKLQAALKTRRETVRDDEMEWMTEDNVEMDMDWCVLESREHAYLANLLESLEMGFGPVASIEMDDMDSMEEELEHTILDKILQEWEGEEDAEMQEGVRKKGVKDYDEDMHTLGEEAEDDLDECIRTINCEGNCSSNFEISCQVPALEVGRGKTNKDMENRIVSTCPTVHLDGVRYVSECIRTVQCAGDCACMTHIANPESE